MMIIESSLETIESEDYVNCNHEPDPANDEGLLLYSSWGDDIYVFEDEQSHDPGLGDVHNPVETRVLEEPRTR